MKIRRIASVLLAATIVTAAMPLNNEKMIADFSIAAAASDEVASGTCGAEGDNLTWTLDGNGTLTISGEGEMYNWESLSDVPWCNNKENITEIVIGDGVTSIGNSAFISCNSLTTVTISDSVTSIGNRAFGFCGSLASITIPDSVTSIGDYAFVDCRSLTSVKIPDNVTSIGDYAFRSCYKISAITIPGSVKEIGECAFIGAGVDTVIIKDGVENIGVRAFYSCANLTSVTIPDSVTSIGMKAFDSCKSLTSITIKNPDCSIYDNADTISDIYDEEKRESDFTGTIYGYEGSTAQAYAEKYNRKFESLVDAPSVSEVASGTCGEDLTWTLDGNGTLTISGEGEMYDWESQSDVPWYNQKENIKGIVIDDGVAGIGDYAFYFCKNLTSITIPNSVVSLGDFAFWWCQSLASITIPDSVTSIGSFVFHYCTGLNSIIIPNSVTNIGIGAFSVCENLTSIIIPDSVTNIEKSTLSRCEKLDLITIENPECEIYDSEDTISDTATIYGYEGSTAQTYAEKYNRKFVCLGNMQINMLGDINEDGKVDARDASSILSLYADISSGGRELTDKEKAICNVNGDASVDARDASVVLAYYADLQSGSDITLEEFLNKEN